MPKLRDVTESDFERVVELNDAVVQYTSHMDVDRLRFLVDLSTYCKVAIVDGQVVAFLIALREGAPYENDNYEWFSARFSRFLYVDRIVVDSHVSRRKIGRALYADMFRFARSQRIDAITCEYNVEPANPASSAFHDTFGFKEIGTQWVAGGAKRVSLQAVETRHAGNESIHRSTEAQNRLAANKRNAIAFYRTAYLGDPAKAVEMYVGSDYIQHNPLVANGKQAFIDYFTEMAVQYPGKEIEFVRAAAEGDLVALHTHQTWPGDDEYVTMDFFRFDAAGKIVEHWDAIQDVPNETKNGNPMY